MISQAGLDLNPIFSPAKKMKCIFGLRSTSDDLQWTQMIGQKTWNAFNFWWLVRWLMDSTPSLQPRKSHFWVMFNFWWSALVWTNPICHPSPAKKWNAHVFGLPSTSDDRSGWLMDSNPICHPSPAKRMKSWTQLLMIGQAGWWTRTPSATPLPAKKWNAHFWITFNFWCSAGLVDGFEPHLPPLCSQKHEMLIFGLHSTSNDRPGWSMDFHLTPLQQKNEMADDRSGWSGIERQKNEMLIFGLRSTSDDWPWSMDLSPVCHLSAAKKMKCPFLDYIQLLMIGRAGPRTPTLSATPLQPKTWNACFWITFNFWWSARLVDALEPHLPPLSSQKNEMLIFGLHSTPDDRPGWSMDSNPIYHLSPATKIKCSFLDYVQLLMISWIGQWTRMPSTTPLQPKTWNACFWITFNFWWLARLVDALKPHLPPLSSQKIEMLIFGLHSTSDDQLGWSMELNPIYHLSPAEKNEMLIFGLHSNSDDKPGWLMDSNPICHPSPAKRMKS